MIPTPRLQVPDNLSPAAREVAAELQQREPADRRRPLLNWVIGIAAAVFVIAVTVLLVRQDSLDAQQQVLSAASEQRNRELAAVQQTLKTVCRAVPDARIPPAQLEQCRRVERGQVIAPAVPGPMGAAGRPGTAGADGVQGPSGAPGQPGEIGEPGPQGPAGERGAGGAPGERGDDGTPGAAGAAGEAGQRGADGAPGASGADGAPGERGEQGARGEPGPPGPACPPGYVVGDAEIDGRPAKVCFAEQPSTPDTTPPLIG